MKLKQLKRGRPKRKAAAKIAVLLAFVGGAAFLANCHRYSRGPDRFLHKMDSYVEDLELDAGQESKYQGIRARIKTDLEARQVERKAVLGRLKTEFDKNDPNVPGATADVKKQIGAMSRTIDRAPDYFLEFYNILNPAQQKQVNEEIRTRLNRWHYWHD